MRVIFVFKGAFETHLIRTDARKKVWQIVKLCDNIKDFRKARLSPYFFDIPYLD
jgi:hypothetical protein